MDGKRTAHRPPGAESSATASPDAEGATPSRQPSVAPDRARPRCLWKVADRPRSARPWGKARTADPQAPGPVTDRGEETVPPAR